MGVFSFRKIEILTNIGKIGIFGKEVYPETKERALNEIPLFRKIPAALHRFRFMFYLVLAFLAGFLCAAAFRTGFFLIGQRSGPAGGLDTRYAEQHRGAAEIVGRLETELGRERELNRRLRDHNSRARELTEGLADATERNVRNLQDAIELIGEIRTKLKILEDFYNDSDTVDSYY